MRRTFCTCVNHVICILVSPAERRGRRSGAPARERPDRPPCYEREAMRPVIFAALCALAVAFFGRTIFAMVRAAARGAADPRPRLDQIPARLLSVLIYFFGQKKVAERGPQHLSSRHHLFIF